MKRVIVFLSILFFTSCFLIPLGAPHHYQYEALNEESIKNVFVFCTPRVKTLHFSAEKDLNINIQSKIFVTNSNQKLEYKDFFSHKEYQLSKRISDRKYHKLHKNDTIRLIINSLNQEQLFVLKKINTNNTTKHKS